MEYSFQRLCFIFVVCVCVCANLEDTMHSVFFFFFFFALTALFDIA